MSLIKHKYLIIDIEESKIIDTNNGKVMSIDFKSEVDTIKAYQKYLIARWNADTKPKWSVRGEPIFRLIGVM